MGQPKSTVNIRREFVFNSQVIEFAIKVWSTLNFYPQFLPPAATLGIMVGVVGFEPTRSLDLRIFILLYVSIAAFAL